MSVQEHPCQHDADFTLLRDVARKVDKIHERLFIDNGKPSIQTALIHGEARMQRLESEIQHHNRRAEGIDGRLKSIIELQTDAKAFMAGISSVLKDQSISLRGSIEEGVHNEGLTKMVMSIIEDRLPKPGVMAHVTPWSAFWIFGTTASVCAALIYVVHTVFGK